MPKITFRAALAAQALAERRQPELRLELRLPAYDRRFEEPQQFRDGEDEPDALVLEADGSFTEVRD